MPGWVHTLDSAVVQDIKYCQPPKPLQITNHLQKEVKNEVFGLLFDCLWL